MTLSCRLIGHRMRFWSEGERMRWRCERGCGEGGSKRYASAREATRYARAFDREDRDDVGRRAPLIGLFPLRIWHKISGRDGQGRGRGR